jgi:serine/threonine-protein kinase HipA
MVIEVVKVKYNEQDVGAVSFNTETGVGAFEFESRFIKSGIELSPIKMPLSKKIYSFPENNNETFKGLPGMIADSLPDDFGNAVPL